VRVVSIKLLTFKELPKKLRPLNKDPVILFPNKRLLKILTPEIPFPVKILKDPKLELITNPENKSETIFSARNT
jgi:hypothetical protein